MSNLATLIDLIELDLKDAANATWSTAELTQHLRRALQSLNDWTPRRVDDSLNCEDDEREYNLVGLTYDCLIIYDLWYPWDSTDPTYPPPRPRWERITDDTIILLVDDPPTDDQDIRVFYTSPHTIDDLDSADATTLSARQESAVVLGATAFAALQYAQSLTNAVASSDWTVRNLVDWATKREQAFYAALRDMARQQIALQDPRVPWAATTRDEGKGGVI